MRRGEKPSSEYWRELNKRRTAYRRAYYAANRERLIAEKKAWVAKHKDYHDEYVREYREAHRVIQRVRSKTWRDKNPHQVTAQAVLRRSRIREKCTYDSGILTFYRMAKAD